MLVSFLLVLFLDVFVLAVIDNFTHWGLSAGCHFHEVKTTLFGHTEGLLRRQHAILLVGDAIHHTDLGRTDALIDPCLVGVTAVVTLGPATWAIERRATAGARLVTSRSGAIDGRCTGRASSGGPCRRLRRGRVIRASAELSGTQIIEWIANG